jgi:hypothetical protein
MSYKFNPFTGNFDDFNGPDGEFSSINVEGDINLDDGGTYTTTLRTITPTAARTISFPDATGTVGLVGGSSGNLVVNQSGAYAGVANSSVDNATGNITLGSRFISSLNGAASAPPGTFTGTWFTGGTATTTKPQVLVEPTGATSTAWSTSGTGLGVNAASGFAGNLLDLQLNGTSRAIVTGAGQLLVGTSSSPSVGPGQYSRLVVQGYVGGDASSGYMSLARGEGAANITSGEPLGAINFTDNAGNTFAQIISDADANAGADDYPGRLTFFTTEDGAATPTERMRITQAGAVLFAKTSNGLTTPGAGFIANTGGVYGEIVQSNNGVSCLYLSQNFNSGTQTAVDLRFNNTQVGTISVSSSATSYNTFSDYRLKENVTPVSDGITRLQQLKPARFNFIADPDKTVDGFLAHEVQTIVPEAITGEKDAVDDDGNPVYQGIDQSKLVPLLTAAIQEAIGEIESLKARLTAAGL